MKNLFNPFQTIALLCSAFACQAFSTELITSVISVEGNAALFTTDTPKTHTVPSCITTGNEQKWSVNADNSSNNNGLHVLINIAKNSNEPIEIISANNCDIIAGIEQASNINIVYKQEDDTQSPIVPAVSSALNFVARTQIQIAESETETPVVEFKLIENNIETDSWVTADIAGDFYLHDYGLLNANSSYTLTTKVTVSSEVDESNVIHFDVVEAVTIGTIIYKDALNNLYFQLPAPHGSKYIKLTSGTWAVTELTTEQWNEAESTLIPSDYTLTFGEFSGDDEIDIKLMNTAGDEVILEGTSTGFKPTQSRRVIFIHSDILGTPVAETDLQGVVQ